MEHLQKKYGFWTATAMVIGIVIGSGVFFKADDVLKAAGGHLPTAILAWIMGGSIMVIAAYVFSKVATRIEKVNGLVDYVEVAYGEKAGYLVAWFMTFIYFPTLVAVLSWVSANYTAHLIGHPTAVWGISIFYMLLFFIINLFSPVLAGKFQVSATVIKLIPLVLVAIVGCFLGLLNGQTFESFRVSAQNITSSGGGLAIATLATAFAYEGWIIATSINSELQDAKRTLPKALVVGTLAVISIYLLYYIGIAGVLSNDQVIELGDGAPAHVISLIFGKVAGTLLTVFVIISCLGTLNGVTMGSVRGMYSIAARNMGPNPKFFGHISPKIDSTLNSGLVGIASSAFWLMVWYGSFHGWWGDFLDISELPVAMLYLVYFVIYIWVMRTFTDLPPYARYIAPVLASCGSLYIMWGASQKALFWPFILLTAVIIGVGIVFMKKKK